MRFGKLGKQVHKDYIHIRDISKPSREKVVRNVNRTVKRIIKNEMKLRRAKYNPFETNLSKYCN